MNPLVCLGINPTTALPNAMDRTVARVSKFAVDNADDNADDNGDDHGDDHGDDSRTMLNVYPRIAIDSKNLDREYRPDLKAENDRYIVSLIDDRPLTLLAAWGGLLPIKPHLPSLLMGSLQLTSARVSDWVSLGDPTNGGHPRHPLDRRVLASTDSLRFQSRPSSRH